MKSLCYNSTCLNQCALSANVAMLIGRRNRNEQSSLSSEASRFQLPVTPGQHYLVSKVLFKFPPGWARSTPTPEEHSAITGYPKCSKCEAGDTGYTGYFLHRCFTKHLCSVHSTSAQLPPNPSFAFFGLKYCSDMAKSHLVFLTFRVI